MLAVFELFFYNLNMALGVHVFGITDVGGSIIIHMFGGMFGLACTKALSTKDAVESKNCSDGYTSNLIAMVGTVFLWMYWPSFNGLLTDGMT